MARIEELFSELDNGIATLKKAQQQLKVYRQAVLKKAFEGELTLEWREAQSDLPDAEQLLTQIKAERERHYQKQMDDWEQAMLNWQTGEKTRGVTPGKKPGKPKKAKELPALTEDKLSELPELPDGWGWVTYETICSKIKNGLSQKPNGDVSDIKIFRISAVRAFKFDLNDYRYIKDSAKFRDFYLEKGDLVFTRYNGTRKYVGVCAQFRINEKYLYPDKLIQTKIFGKVLDSTFYEYATNTSASRKFLESRIRTTAGQSGISGSDIRNMPIPLCSLAEQEQIVLEIESRLSVCDKVEEGIRIDLERAEALRQSILKKAFEGRLLSEAELEACRREPDWEPAAVLLERIREEKSLAEDR